LPRLQVKRKRSPRKNSFHYFEAIQRKSRLPAALCLLRQEFPPKCSDPGQRGRLLHNEQFAPFYGNVPFKIIPNLHAGLSQAEMRKQRWLRCSLFRSLPLWPLLVFLLSDWWEVCATYAAVGGGRFCLPRWLPFPALCANSMD
jgi:hypothetical protein